MPLGDAAIGSYWIDTVVHHMTAPTGGECDATIGCAPMAHLDRAELGTIRSVARRDSAKSEYDHNRAINAPPRRYGR
jgi:hypothetical protein